MKFGAEHRASTLSSFNGQENAVKIGTTRDSFPQRIAFEARGDSELSTEAGTECRKPGDVSPPVGVIGYFLAPDPDYFFAAANRRATSAQLTIFQKAAM